MKKFKLELTEEQVNYVLNVLAERPFKECQSVLAEIQNQASSQIEESVETMEVVND